MTKKGKDKHGIDFFLLLSSLHAAGATPQPSKAELVEVKKIWDKAPHNYLAKVKLPSPE